MAVPLLVMCLLGAAASGAWAARWSPGDVLLEGTLRHPNGKLYRNIVVRDGMTGDLKNDPLLIYPLGDGDTQAPRRKLTRPQVSFDGKIMVTLGVPAGKTLSLVVVDAGADQPQTLMVEPLARHLAASDPAPLLGAVDVDSVYTADRQRADGAYAVFMYGLAAEGRGPVVMRWSLQTFPGAAPRRASALEFVETVAIPGYGDEDARFFDYYSIQVFRPYQMVMHAVRYPLADNSQPQLEAYTFNWKTKEVDVIPVAFGQNQPLPTLTSPQWEATSVPAGFLSLTKSLGKDSSGRITNVYTCSRVQSSGRTSTVYFLPTLGGNATASTVDDWYGLATDSSRVNGPDFFYSIRRSSGAMGATAADPVMRLVKISINDSSSAGEYPVDPDPTLPAAMATALGVVRTPRNYSVNF